RSLAGSDRSGHPRARGLVPCRRRATRRPRPGRSARPARRPGRRPGGGWRGAPGPRRRGGRLRPGQAPGRTARRPRPPARRGAGRPGLGLLACDGWTGVDRDTSTLSGGETFLASLALALGLADVVTAEAGGTRIEALFVDEGFGSLDEDTLEEVMTVLDGLREGGRMVGIVSHVAELRQRIPAQVRVRKGQAGSHLTVRTQVS